MIFRLVGACFVASCLLTSQALAHGGVSVQENKCVMKIGPYLLSFTGYQPEKTYDKFCDDIPGSGRTVVVFDAEQSSAGANAAGAANSNDLRDMAIDFRVLRNVGQASDEDNMEQNTEVYMAPKKYPTGTLHFEHDFKNGNYIGLVSAKNDHGQVFVSRFPFAVGTTAGGALMVYGIGGVVAIGAIAGYFFYTRRKSAA